MTYLKELPLRLPGTTVKCNDVPVSRYSIHTFNSNLISQNAI